MQLTRRSSDYREIDWEQPRLVNHFRLIDFAGQVQPTFRRSPMLHLGIVQPDERGLITSPLGLAAVRLTTKLTCRGRCNTRMSRETSMAAPVRCSAWFGGCLHGKISFGRA